jgi:hypothetical protein
VVFAEWVEETQISCCAWKEEGELVGKLQEGWLMIFGVIVVWAAEAVPWCLVVVRGVLWVPGCYSQWVDPGLGEEVQGWFGAL